jgi:hypothetical protein
MYKRWDGVMRTTSRGTNSSYRAQIPSARSHDAGWMVSSKVAEREQRKRCEVW